MLIFKKIDFLNSRFFQSILLKIKQAKEALLRSSEIQAVSEILAVSEVQATPRLESIIEIETSSHHSYSIQVRLYEI